MRAIPGADCNQTNECKRQSYVGFDAGVDRLDNLDTD
jgi:hypothetical protein